MSGRGLLEPTPPVELASTAAVAGAVIGVGVLGVLAVFVAANRAAFYVGRVVGWAGTGCPL